MSIHLVASRPKTWAWMPLVLSSAVVHGAVSRPELHVAVLSDVELEVVAKLGLPRVAIDVVIGHDTPHIEPLFVALQNCIEVAFSYECVRERVDDELLSWRENRVIDLLLRKYSNL